MRILNSKKELDSFLKQNTLDLAFVPTMGNLHDGHLSLIDTAKKYSKNVIVSIFVNPTQFGVNEDFSTYPRTINEDIERLNTKDVTVLYMPTVHDIYPITSKMWFDIPSLTHVLCGKSRPHFFNGVMTVLLKFFLQIKPRFCILGEKDYQQYLVVKEMVRSIGMNIDVISSPIIRNKAGLALSSRNGYFKDLSLPEKINKVLVRGAIEILETQNPSTITIAENLKAIIDEPDYLELRSSEDLSEFKNGYDLKNYRLFFAGKLQGVRLIDNISLGNL